MGRANRDFQQRAARGDPRALRDIASGRAPRRSDRPSAGDIKRVERLKKQTSKLREEKPTKNPKNVASGKKGGAVRKALAKKQIKFDPNAPTIREARKPGAGIPKKGFTDAQFNKLFRPKGSGGGGGGIGSIFDSGTGARTGKKRPGR